VEKNTTSSNGVRMAITLIKEFLWRLDSDLGLLNKENNFLYKILLLEFLVARKYHVTTFQYIHAGPFTKGFDHEKKRLLLH
jgi:hypothetical protein